MKLFRKIKGKLGFTLAEMLIVVAILAILTAVAAPNVAKYSRGINLRELNDSARAIYMAAEHKFMNEIEMGNELPGLDDGAAKITALLPRYDKTSEVDIFYLKSNDSGSPLKKLMSSGGTDVESTGVVESQLFDNNFIVEYNPKTGDVYGVFYSEKENFDDYTTNFYSDVADVQSKKLIGYYGLMNEKPDAHPVVQEIEKPTVEVINKEKLVVRITAPSGTTIDRFYVKADVDGTSIIPDSGRYMSGGQTVELVLDCLDGPAYAPSINEGPLVDKYEASADVWGISCDGADKTLTVSFYDNNGIARDQSVTKTFNPLFANGSTAGTAYIEYGRHLQNLDKCSAITTAVIKKTINFASTDSEVGEFGGWATYYSDFITLVKCKALNISARSGAEIQNISIITNPDDKYYAGLFAELSGKATDLTFRNPTVNGSIAGTLCGFSSGCTIDNVKVINPKVNGDNSAGGLAGMDGMSTISNCYIYVEDSSWDYPTIDPYSNYIIKAGSSASGGLIGATVGTTVTGSYASVKVNCDSASGGLIGTCTIETIIENSFAGGHTYYGIFKGTSKDSKTVSLEDNVSGMTAGGIAGEIDGNGLILKGTVFSTCSVTGTAKADPAYNYKIDTPVTIDPAATVYTLGTAYLPDGTKTTKSSDERVKTGDEVKVDDSSAAVGKRYDLKVSSVYKYPLPTTGMTMHGDWPSSDAVTGFFYWEKEVADTTSYHFHVLWYGNGKPDELKIPAASQLCKEQDGSNITAYGYGAFSVGGSLDSAVTFSDGTSTDVTNADVESAVQTALAAVDDLKITDSGTVAVKLYNVTGVSGKTFVTATIGGNDYTFAPDFYAISADKGSDHAGTDADVFGVRCKNHLQNVANALSGSFKQSHDINYKDDTTGLTPIGDSTNKFTGTYNGGSYRIINAKFNTTDTTENAGLFGVTDGAKLENIVMFNEAATADEFDKNKIEGKNVGVIVGEAAGAGSINNCVAAGYTVIGSENSGGIAGVSACPITNCEANIRFGKVQNVAGGIVGNGAEISSCYALVHGIESPSSDMDLGGIAGAASEVKNCYVIFSGQTVGYPVANKAEYSTCYYVNDEGYYSVSESGKTNSAQGVALESLKTLEGKNLDKFNLSPVTYDSDVTPSGNNYQYPAVFKDGGTTEHYGPVPAKIMYTSSLVRGPVAGIFDVHMYGEDNGTGGLNTDNSIDGLFSYNRAGVMNYDNMWDGSKPSYDEFIGVFTCKESFFEDPSHNPSLLEFKDIMVLDYFSPRVRVLVDGEEIKKENIRELNYGSVRSGYYQFKSDAGVTDEFFVNHQPGIPVQKAFKLFTLWKNGKEIKAEDVHSGIQVMYLDDYGKWGLLIECKAPSFRGEKTSSYVDSLPIPKVGAFIASTYAPHTEDMSRYINPYFASAYLTENGSDGSAYGQIGDNAGAQAYLCVLVEKDYSKYLNSNDLVFNICGAPATLEKWDNVINAEIANAKALNFDNYDVYVITNMLSITRNNSVNTGQHTIEAQFGSREIMHIEYTKLQKDLIKVDKYIMPKFGMGALYFKAKTDQNPDQYFVNGKFADLSEEGTYTKAADFGYSNTEGLLKTGTYLIYIQTSRLSERNDFKVEINGKEYSLGNEVVSENIGWGRGDFTALIINTTDTINDDDVIQLKFRNDVVMKFAAKLF